MFDEIFRDVMETLGVEDWYDLFTSNAFEIVEDRISAELGYDCWEDEDFIAWRNEMSAAL
jgi:hypothetical protein